MHSKPPGLLIRGPVDGTAKICTCNVGSHAALAMFSTSMTRG